MTDIDPNELYIGQQFDSDEPLSVEPSSEASSADAPPRSLAQPAEPRLAGSHPRSASEPSRTASTRRTWCSRTSTTKAQAIEPIDISLEKNDIGVDEVSLLWLPVG